MIRQWIKEFFVDKMCFYVFVGCIIVGAIYAFSGATNTNLSIIGGYYRNNFMVDRVSYIYRYFLYFLPGIFSFVIVEKTYQEKDMYSFLYTREKKNYFIFKKLGFAFLIGLILGLALWGTYSFLTYIIYYINPFKTDLMVPGNEFLFHNFLIQSESYESDFANLIFTQPLLFTLYHSFFYSLYQGLWFMVGYGLSLCLKYRVLVYLLLLCLPIMTEYLSARYGMINAFSITVSNVYIINRTLWKGIYTLVFTVISSFLCLWHLRNEDF